MIPTDSRTFARIERQREKEKEAEMPAKFIPPASAFPHPMPPVTVQLPGDGSGEAIREYFDRTYGKTPQNKTAERARRLCAKLAQNLRQEEYREVGRWWETWTRNRIAEEDGYPKGEGEQNAG